MSPRPASPRLRRLLPIAAAAVIGIAAGAGAYALANNNAHASAAPTTPSLVVPAQPASSTSTSDSLTELYKQDSPGVVDITVQSTSGGGSSQGFPFGQPQGKQQSEAEGTGFVIDTEGDIITAEHVVAAANSITVHWQDGSSTKATLVGSDKSTDTAVIHVDVDASKLHP